MLDPVAGVCRLLEDQYGQLKLWLSGAPPRAQMLKGLVGVCKHRPLSFKPSSTRRLNPSQPTPIRLHTSPADRRRRLHDTRRFDRPASGHFPVNWCPRRRGPFCLATSKQDIRLLWCSNCQTASRVEGGELTHCCACHRAKKRSCSHGISYHRFFKLWSSRFNTLQLTRPLKTRRRRRLQGRL
jgi:hypothetical protein